MIDNGQRVRIAIAGLFDGTAGESEGVIAFVPVRASPAPRVVAGKRESQIGIFNRIDGYAAAPFVAYKFEAAL